MIDAVFVRDGVVDCVIRNVDILPEGAIAAAPGTVFGGYTYAESVFSAPPAPEPGPDPVPDSVTNYQARAIMRTVPMPDGRSLFTTVDTDLRAAVEATKALPEFHPDRIRADLAWQAWEQANTYDRRGLITGALAEQYGFDGERTDDLFRQANLVTA